MKTLLLIALAVASLHAQITLEDFSCPNIVSATPGNPTVVTCGTAHGMEGLHAFTYGTMASSLTPGSTLTVDGVAYSLQASINNATAGQVLIGAGTTALAITVQNLLHALNDDGIGKGTLYSSATTAHPTAFGMFAGGSLGQAFEVYAKTAGTAGTSVTASATTSISVTNSTLRLQWPIYVSGATGAWAGIGSAAAPKVYATPNNSNMARYVNSTQFSVPFDSHLLTWDGQTGIQIQRGAGDGNALTFAYTDESWAVAPVLTAAGFQLNVPACTDTSNDLACSRGYIKPENQKGYMCRGNTAISDFVVSGGTITITFAGLWSRSGVTQDCSAFPDLVPGVVVWPRGFYAYATAANPLSLPAQPLAGYFAAQGSGKTACGGPTYPTNLNDCEGFVVQTKTTVSGGTQTQITIRNPGLVNGDYGAGTCADGHCMGSTAATGYAATTWLATPYSYFLPRWGGYYAPAIGAVGNLKTGLYPLPVNANRLIANATYNVSIQHRGTYSFELGTYTQGQPGSLVNSTAHYYHDLDPDVYPGQLYKLEFTGVPSHQVNEPGTGRWMANPNSFSPYYGFSGTGNPAYSYWYGMADFYIDGPNTYTSAATAGISPTYRSLQLDTVTGEPDEWVPNRASVFSPNRYIGGVLTANQGYEVHWFTANTGAQYQVRYLTTGSLKSAGWASGTDGGTVSVQNSYEYYWQSATLAQQPNIWIGIRPIMPVTWAASSGAAYWVGTDLDPAMSVGNHVTVVLNGNTATNVASTAVQPRQVWWLFQPSYPYTSVWSGSGGLTNIVASGGTCTANFSVNHNLVPGWKIKVLGTTNATLGSGMYDQNSVDYTVASTPTAQSLTFPCPSVPAATYASDGNATAGTHMTIMSYPGVLIPGTSPGYAAAGTMVSTESTSGFSEINLTSGPVLTTAPGTLAYAYTIGGSAPAAQNLALDASGGTLAAWTITCPSWASCSPTSGTGASTVSVGINTAGLTAGPYSDSITYSATGFPTPASVPITLTVLPAPSAVVVTTTTLSAQWRQAYSGQMAASGGTPPYTWTGSGLPGGFSLSSAGVLTGTPSTIGTFTFNATATDSVSSSSGPTPITLLVNPPPPSVSVYGYKSSRR